jgi:hypothetical protein
MRRWRGWEGRDVAIDGLDIRRNRCRIDIACNDPDNGLFAHRAEQIHVGDNLMEFEARREPAPRFIETPTGFRMAGKNWPTQGCKAWVGNWCWNGYWLDIPVAVDFFVWLQGRKLFDLSCGETRLFNMWRLVRGWDADDRAFLDRMLGKPSNFGAV